eukprot:TRINITY_DN32038_c0_g1_i1.p1 TRINITY_DN32038_c0_g1~~TRINITY_DN32038_c0_g1_i1.p1  ORF type:complete len:933 (+),score=311.52 TRINITY_DN32038_c0_g1_i1:85-2799(+)
MRAVVPAAVAALLLPAHASKWPLRRPGESVKDFTDVDAVPASFDCGMRKLAYQYGKQLLPRQGSFESLYYALDLNSEDCHTDLTGAAPTREEAAVPADAIYVSPSGNDGASGTLGAPLRSIQQAADLAADRGGSRTVVLRAGTHYIKESILLTPRHNDVTLRNYPGEEPVVSGGVELKVDWKPYNVTPPAPPGPKQWIEEDGKNYVYGCTVDGKTFVDLGKFDNKTACEAACKASSNCHAYTWHDSKQGSYALKCISRTDGYYETVSQSGHYSGRDSTAVPTGSGPTPPARKNIWTADVRGQTTGLVQGLQLNGVRATRARYPNLPGGLEVSPGYNGMVSGGDGKWTPPDFNKFGKVNYYTDTTKAHFRNDTTYGFNEYMIGINGLCSVYDPPVSYWCSQHPTGGGAFAFRTPSGVIPKAGALPHSPYADVSDMLMFVWRPARWANWMFEIGSYDHATNNFTFGKGGNQGARGNNEGGDFFVEGVMEELDYPGEFFHNSSTGQLYLFYNGTGQPPADMKVVVPTTKVLVNHTGTQWNPVKNVKITGVKFMAAGPTFMGPHGVPSAGDWALDRFGTVFLEGTEGVTIEGCTFERLDGNGVMVSGYNRNATIHKSDFAYLGGNAVAAWGYTNETSGDNHPQAGVDGTDGNHPRYTTVTSCSAREVGLYEKQSSFFIQAKTAQSTISGNVFFNGPRAGINANDGFGGGDEISHNLVFSTCRESGDHGPFNSWDRQPFLTTVRTGEPSMYMQWREIHHNFFIDNYSPQENVDNDDGSCYYKTHDNFLVYGNQGMKNDFGGHDNHHQDNIYAYTGKAMGTCSQIKGHADMFTGNKVVMTGSDVGGVQCGGEAPTVMNNNQYFTSNGDVNECGTSLNKWIAKGHEQGSSVSTFPSDDTILGWAKEKLGIN